MDIRKKAASVRGNRRRARNNTRFLALALPVTMKNQARMQQIRISSPYLQSRVIILERAKV